MDYSLDDFLKDGESGGEVPKNVSPEAIEKGTEVELEHTTNKTIARKIALDHLAENPDYYELLEQIEKKHPPEKKTAAYEEWFTGNPPTLPLTIDQIKSQLHRADVTAALGKADARRVQTKDGSFVGIGSDMEYEQAYAKAMEMLGSRGNVSELDSYFGPGQNYIVVLAGV